MSFNVIRENKVLAKASKFTILLQTNNEDPDETPYKAAFYQGLYYLLRQKQLFRIET